MAKRSNVGRWILLSVVAVFLAGIFCCCSGVALLWYSPSMFLNWLVQDDPIAVPSVPANPDIKRTLNQRFAQGGAVRVTGTELTQLVLADDPDDLEAFYVDVDGNIAELMLSVDFSKSDSPAKGYLNVHLRGEVEIERGWFTHMQVDTVAIGPLELGSYVAGQELAQDANRSLADTRAKDPDLSQTLDDVVRLVTKDGAFEIELEEGAFERMQARQSK